MSKAHVAISVIIITKNEIRNIAQVLHSVSFADEVIVVDSGSTDGTIKTANSFKNVKILNFPWKGYVENKMFAIEQTKHDWILWLDADEVLSEESAKHWQNLDIKNLENIGGFTIKRKNFFQTHALTHAWPDDELIRFFHKSRAGLNQKFVHERVVVDNKYKTLPISGCLFHYSYKSLSHLFQKMHYYGELSAAEISRKNKKGFKIKIFTSPLWFFIKTYFIKKGYKDGFIGFVYCASGAYSHFIKYCTFFLKEAEHKVLEQNN